MQQKLKLSQRRVCRALSQPRATQRYVAAQRRNDEARLTRRLHELALRHPRFGYRRITALLRGEGWRVNRKRVQRLWRQEGLKVPRKQRKTRRRHDGSSDNACHRRRPAHINHVWSFDFCHDRTADGRALKIFSVIDEYTRRCLAIEVQRRITGADVVRILSALMALHGVPQHVRCDNGPEFICAAVKAWLGRAAVAALYIAPGSPWENAYAESYHARLRDEVLSREEFATLSQARAILEVWRAEYNHHRPHSALEYQTPEAFAAAAAAVGRAHPCSAALRRAGHDAETSTRGVAQQVV